MEGRKGRKEGIRLRKTRIGTAWAADQGTYHLPSYMIDCMTEGRRKHHIDTAQLVTAWPGLAWLVCMHTAQLVPPVLFCPASSFLPSFQIAQCVNSMQACTQARKAGRRAGRHARHRAEQSKNGDLDRPDQTKPTNQLTNQPTPCTLHPCRCYPTFTTQHGNNAPST